MIFGRGKGAEEIGNAVASARRDGIGAQGAGDDEFGRRWRADRCGRSRHQGRCRGRRRKSGSSDVAFSNMRIAPGVVMVSSMLVSPPWRGLWRSRGDRRDCRPDRRPMTRSVRNFSRIASFFMGKSRLVAGEEGGKSIFLLQLAAVCVVSSSVGAGWWNWSTHQVSEACASRCSGSVGYPAPFNWPGRRSATVRDQRAGRNWRR